MVHNEKCKFSQPNSTNIQHFVPNQCQQLYLFMVIKNLQQSCIQKYGIKETTVLKFNHNRHLIQEIPNHPWLSLLIPIIFHSICGENHKPVNHFSSPLLGNHIQQCTAQPVSDDSKPNHSVSVYDQSQIVNILHIVLLHIYSVLQNIKNKIPLLQPKNLKALHSNFLV